MQNKLASNTEQVQLKKSMTTKPNWPVAKPAAHHHQQQQRDQHKAEKLCNWGQLVWKNLTHLEKFYSYINGILIFLGTRLVPYDK